MVLRSTRAAAVVAAAAIALTACTAPESGEPTPAPSDAAADTASATPTDGTQEPTQDGSAPQVQATSGALVDGMPSVLVPMEDAEIVSSSVQPAGDGQPVAANITMRVDASEEDVLDFYADHFEDADFAPVGDPASDDGITTQTYHADEGGQLVSIGISQGTGDQEGLLVTVGGQVLP